METTDDSSSRISSNIFRFHCNIFCSVCLKLMVFILRVFVQNHLICMVRCGSRGGAPGARAPPDPRFWGPKIEHFWALFNFSLIFFASIRSAYYFFNMLLFQSSNSKIFQPRFARHMISHLEVFVFSLSFTHFRLLGVHLSLSFF